MGTKNRQRRAAKQRKRQQGGPRRTDHRTDRQAAGDDPYTLVATFVYAAADAVGAGDAAGARNVIGLLEEGPPVPGAEALVARVLADITAQHRAYALAHGWTEADLDELRRRRLKVPAGRSDVERQVRWLSLLTALGPLPSVEPPSAAPAADAGMLAKIRALLAKAESTTFPEEAESLSAKAQELMARHRIDRVLVEAGDAGDGPVGRRIWLDDPYADAKARLLASVADANRCRAVLLGKLGCTHLIGFLDDLDMTELLHTSLLVQATRAMAAAGPQIDARGRSRTRSFRQSFLVAYAWRIGERLHEAVEAAEAEVDAEQGGDLLPVLARRDAQLDDAVAAAFPRAAPMKMKIGNPAGWAAGAAAAELADLSAGQHLARPTG